jgi:predicted PurR-regulated permease PerM
MPRQNKHSENSISVPHTQHVKSDISKIDIVILGTGIALLLLLLYTIQTVLSPFVIFGSTVFLLYPLRRHQLAKNLIWLSTALFLLWFVYTVGGILAPFIVALLLAYVLHPFVTLLEHKKIPRWLSSLIIIVLSIVIVTTTLILIVPMAFQQFEGILQTLNAMVTQATTFVLNDRFSSFLQRYGVSAEQLRQIAQENLTKHIEDIIKGLLQGAFGVVSEFSAIVTRLVNIVIIPFLTFYFLKDFPVVINRIRTLVPQSKRERFQVFTGYIDDILGRYIRGTATIAVIDAAAVSTIFWLIGIQYPLVLGITSGILYFIPYFGVLTMLFITSIVASLSPPPVMPHLVLALCTLGILHITENFILSPRIIGGKIGLHPVMLILSLFTFAFFLGFIGLLIAIPTTALIIVFVKEWERHSRKDQYITDILEDRLTEESHS